MSRRASEDELIAKYFAPIAGPDGLGLLDDAACVTPPPGRQLVLTADALVEADIFSRTIRRTPSRARLCASICPILRPRPPIRWVFS